MSVTELTKVYTEADVARHLGVSEETVARERRRGRLRYTLAGTKIRFTSAHIEQYLADRRQSLMKRYAARRDAAEPELIAFAKNLGWRFWKLDTPCDWLGMRRGIWWPIEIKDPSKEGHADEYTYDQRKFMAEVAACGGRVLVWRSKDCVLRDSGARESA